MNSLVKAIAEGYGIETDIRDYFGKLVISHNIADNNSQLLEDFLIQYKRLGSDACLALNIKADGLQGLINELTEKYDVQNYFLFDMSIPEMVVNREKNLKFFTRHSDIEQNCVLYDYAEGVWIDSFYDNNWLTGDIIHKHLKYGKKIGIISPEIHGADHKVTWELLLKNSFFKNNDVMLCTDIPDMAKEYFKL